MSNALISETALVAVSFNITYVILIVDAFATRNDMVIRITSNFATVCQ